MNPVWVATARRVEPVLCSMAKIRIADEVEFGLTHKAKFSYILSPKSKYVSPMA